MRPSRGEIDVVEAGNDQDRQGDDPNRIDQSDIAIPVDPELLTRVEPDITHRYQSISNLFHPLRPHMRFDDLAELALQNSRVSPLSELQERLHGATIGERIPVFPVTASVVLDEHRPREGLEPYVCSTRIPDDPPDGELEPPIHCDDLAEWILVADKSLGRGLRHKNSPGLDEYPSRIPRNNLEIENFEQIVVCDVNAARKRLFLILHATPKGHQADGLFHLRKCLFESRPQGPQRSERVIRLGLTHPRRTNHLVKSVHVRMESVVGGFFLNDKQEYEARGHRD